MAAPTTRKKRSTKPAPKPKPKEALTTAAPEAIDVEALDASRDDEAPDASPEDLIDHARDLANTVREYLTEPTQPTVQPDGGLTSHTERSVNSDEGRQRLGERAADMGAALDFLSPCGIRPESAYQNCWRALQQIIVAASVRNA